MGVVPENLWQEIFWNVSASSAASGTGPTRFVATLRLGKSDRAPDS